MKRSMKVTAALAAGGVLAAGGALAAGPVFAAGASDQVRQTQQTSQIGQAGQQRERAREADCREPGACRAEPGRPGGRGGAMAGPRAGAEGMPECAGLAPSAPTGDLGQAQRAALVDAAGREKLAADLAEAFAERYDAVVFDRIAAAESRHLNALRALLDRYGLTDPTEGKPAGEYGDPALQERYEQLLRQGRTGQQAALEAGRAVEETQVRELTELLDGLGAPDVQQVATRLLEASRTHLTAFDDWMGRD